MMMDYKKIDIFSPMIFVILVIIYVLNIISHNIRFKQNIKDSVRHSNFKEQCEFFNEEFNQYGIEFIYISP